MEGFEDSLATEEFFLMVDQLFDHLNSRQISGLGHKAPLSLRNISAYKEFVSRVEKELLGLRDLKGKLLYETRKGTGILGLICCARSLLDLGEALLPTGDLGCLLGYKFSQDHLELFFNASRGTCKFDTYLIQVPG